jgi:hypothetical protein
VSEWTFIRPAEMRRSGGKNDQCLLKPDYSKQHRGNVEAPLFTQHLDWRAHIFADVTIPFSLAHSRWIR